MNKKWKVVRFDENTLRCAAMKDNVIVYFHTTSFQSDTGFRWPRVGEAVDVVFTKNGDVLSVHGA